MMKSKRNSLKLVIDRALSLSIWKQIAIMLILLGILLGISYLLLWCSKPAWESFRENSNIRINYWLLPIYLLIDTNALNAIYMGGAKGGLLIASTVVYVFGLIVCSGMLIGVITNYISDRVQKHRDGLKHYVKSGHCIIMGYDDMVPSIIKEIFSKMPKTDVVLLTAMDARQVKEKLLRSEVRDKMDQIFVTYGLCMVKDYYKKIHLEAAEKIYIVGDRSLPAHDAINVECIDSIRDYLNDYQSGHKPKRINCVFEDLDTYAAFKTTEIFSEISNLGIDFIPYSFYSGWAGQVFIRRSYCEKNREGSFDYPSVYGDGITPDDKKYVHLVFVGTTNFSVAFAMEAAHLLHFPNFETDHSLKTRITFIEKKADEELRIFATRNRHFFEVQPYYYRKMTAKRTREERREDLLDPVMEHGFLDVEFEFIKGDAYSPEVQRLLQRWANEHKEKQYLSIFLAMSNQRDNFTMGMNMPDEVYENAVPVFIRQNRADDFVTNLRSADDKENKYYYIQNNQKVEIVRKGRYANIYPFGMDDMAYFSDETAFYQAKLINYLYSNSNNNRFPDTLVLNALSDETIWDDADKAWRELKVSERWSNLYAAYSIRCKLDSLRAMRELDKDDHSRDQSQLSSTEIEAIAKVEHNRWNVEKLLMGYRKAKPEEDRYDHKAYAKEWKSNKNNLYIHSDIRPFDDLDGIQQLDKEIAKFIPWILTMSEKKRKQDEDRA